MWMPALDDALVVPATASVLVHNAAFSLMLLSARAQLTSTRVLVNLNRVELVKYFILIGCFL
jgi:hypothetical protein